MSSLATESRPGPTGELPTTIYLTRDIDNTERSAQIWIFPSKAALKMAKRLPIRPTEEELREIITRGQAEPKPHDTYPRTLGQKIDDFFHGRRKLNEGVAEAIQAIKEAGAETGREIVSSNLSGREPYLRGTTIYNQWKDGLAPKVEIRGGMGHIVEPREWYDLNPGVGSYNHKAASNFARLTGTGRFEGHKGNVVHLDDDEIMVQIMDALNSLEEVREAGTQIITFRKSLGFWNSEWMLGRSGINPNENSTIIPFNDFNQMAEECTRRIKAGLI